MKSQTDKNHQLELSPSEERPSAESPTSRNELELTCGEVEEHQPQGEEQERRMVELPCPSCSASEQAPAPS